jgi:hypothetical protein
MNWEIQFQPQKALAGEGLKQMTKNLALPVPLCYTSHPATSAVCGSYDMPQNKHVAT